LMLASSIARLLKSQRDKATSHADPLARDITHEELTDLTAHDRRVVSESHEANLLRYISGGWPGVNTFQPNWRESRSLSMSNDFFGGAECKATIRTLYVRIVEDLLSMFEDRGYNTDAYRDASGKLTINAGVINNMAVGDTIHINESGEKPAAGPAPAHGAKPAQAGNAAAE